MTEPQRRHHPDGLPRGGTVNPVVALAHAVAARATLTSAAEWQRMAREAIREYDRVALENAELKRAIKNSGPKFQGMTELA